YEPALGPVDFTDYLSGCPVQTSERQYVTRDMANDAGDPSMEGSLYSDEEWQQTAPILDWIIVGGESGPGARPFHPRWARRVVEQCKQANVACFFKQMGSNVVESNDAGFDGNDGIGWPAHLMEENRIEDLE